MTSDVRTGTITVDGIRAPLLTAGPPDADEAVVFVLGNPGPSDDWRRLVTATGTFARAVDMPGYGGADKPVDFPYTVAGYAGHLERVLDHVGIRRALHDDLRRLDLPALVVWGARDPYVDVGFAPRQRETFPRAEVVILDDSGHWPMFDNPVAVERAVTRFLRQHVAAGADE